VNTFKCNQLMPLHFEGLINCPYTMSYLPHRTHTRLCANIFTRILWQTSIATT